MKKLMLVVVCFFAVPAFMAVQADLASAMGKKPKKEDLRFYRVDPEDLLTIGLTEDSFPPILEPKFDTVDKTSFGESEPVIGVVINGEAKAYPIGILNYHELVNDTVGKKPILVSYSVLTDMGIVYSGMVGKEESKFSHTGEVFRSSLVFYDGPTRTYWSQGWGIGIKGAKVNVPLVKFPAVRTTLGLWKKAHPDTVVLSPKTGKTRNYFKYPYGDYATTDKVPYPVPNLGSLKLHPKEPVTFVAEPDEKVVHNRFSGLFRQFVNSSVKAKGFEAAPFGNRWIVALWDADLQTVRVCETAEEAASVSGNQVTLKSGVKVAVGKLKEMPSSRAFAFAVHGLFQ